VTTYDSARSPYQTADWYGLAGWTARIRHLGPRDPVWLLERDGAAHYFHDPIELITGRLEDRFTHDIDVQAVRRATEGRKILLTISPYGYRGGLSDPGVIPEMLAYAEREGAALVVSHYLFDDYDDAWLAALTAAGGLKLVMGADAVLDVEWGSLAEYRRWLGSSRRSQRHGPGVPDEANLVWETREDPGLPPGDVIDLLARSAARFDPAAPPPDTLLREAAQGKTLPRTLLTVAEPGRPPRSAAVVLRSPDGSPDGSPGGALYAKFFGSRRPRADYIPLAYPRLIGYAIERGFRRIEYGGASHHAKLLRGARLRPAWGVLFVLDEALRRVVIPAARLVGARKLGYFSALARTWQVASLPVHPAFEGGPGFSCGGDR
jgi:hypothetical protein